MDENKYQFHNRQYCLTVLTCFGSRSQSICTWTEIIATEHFIGFLMFDGTAVFVERLYWAKFHRNSLSLFSFV